MPKRYADQEILRMLRTSDTRVHDAAVRCLYEVHEPKIIRYVLVNSGSREDAEELLTDVILVFYKNARDPSFVLHAKISTYIYSVTKRKWLKELEKRKIRPKLEMELDEGMMGNESELAGFENRDRVQRMFEKLEPGCRKLLKAFMEGWSMEDIAVMVGLKNADSAKAQKYNCLKKLGKLINPSL